MNFEQLEANVPADDTHMKMPHPLRVPACEMAYVDGLRKMLSPECGDELVELFKNDNLMTADVLARVIDKPGFEPVQRLVSYSTQLPGGSEVGNLYASLLCMRNHFAPQPFFRVDDALCELLSKTDLDDDLPLDVLRVPYPRFYVEFGQSRSLPLVVPNPMSGDHVLEGAYVEYGTRADVGLGLYVLLTASPLGKHHALDDATHALFMPMDERMNLKEAILWSFNKGNENARNHGLYTASSDTIAPTLECVNFLAKVLLYIGLPEARRSVHPEKSQWVKATAALKSTAKRSKAERKARRLVDYILITAPPASLGQAVSNDNGEPHRSVKTHWRRGHYRLQAHGPQNSQRKLAFIRPQLINSAHGTTAVEAPKYRVS